MTNSIFAMILFMSVSRLVVAQDLIVKEINQNESVIVYAKAFKGTHVINGHSTKTKAKGELDFLIYHRFGPVNDGIYQLFGLDQANMRIGFEYGLTGWLDLGIGRSTYEKNYDGYVKWKFLRQKSGAKNTPVSMVWLSSVAIPTVRIQEELTTAQRMSFTHQLLISRKFGQRVTLQLMPGMVHLNTVPEKRDPNDIFYLGAAYRIKVTPSLALTGEYYYRFNPLQSVQTYDVVGIGVDIETGGHVFQLHFTNSRPTYEKGFITDTTDNFWDGDIRFGFNISRTFQIGRWE